MRLRTTGCAQILSPRIDSSRIGLRCSIYTVAGALQRLLDVGDQSVELDRALHEPPNAGAGDEDHDRGDATQPYENAVRVPADMLRRSSARPALTGSLRRASLTRSAGVAR